MKPSNRESDRQKGGLGRGLNVPKLEKMSLRILLSPCFLQCSAEDHWRARGVHPGLLFLRPPAEVEKEFSPESSPAAASLFLSELSDIDFVKSLLFLSLLYRQVDYPLKAVRDFPTSRCSTWSSSHLFLGRTWTPVSHRPLLTRASGPLERRRVRTELRAGLRAARTCL